MRAVYTLVLLVASGSATLLAQNPFQFREAALLERRISTGHVGPEDVSVRTETRQAVADAIANNERFTGNPEAAKAYTRNWSDRVDVAESYAKLGELETAEKLYILLLEMLRTARGSVSSEVALMLDRLGEFYLGARDFDHAHEKLSEAVQVRRNDLNILDHQAPATDPGGIRQVAGARIMVRLHLADMLARLGEIDLAKGDLAAATRELSESVTIGNEDGNRNYVSGLYAIYFQSLLLEREKKWREAEDLWKEAVRLRETTNSSHWEAMTEMAAFYARRGDFRSGADIVRQVTLGVAGKKLDPELQLPHGFNALRPFPYALDPRSMQRAHYAGSSYGILSDTAMSEILAVDKWRTDGPDAAAALLKDPFAGSSDKLRFNATFSLDEGPDSERAQLLAWFEKVVFLQMSILLDGEPSQDRVDKAYEMLSIVKGRYLAPDRLEAARLLEADRSNPGHSCLPPCDFHLLDQRADASASEAHIFIASALDGQQFKGLQFAAQERVARFVAGEIFASKKQFARSPASLRSTTFPGTLPADAAFIDIVVWERSDRAGMAPPRREYGAFVVCKGQPVRYVRIGPAEGVDRDIDGLEAGILGNRLRGIRVPGPVRISGPAEIQQLQKSLYSKVIGPMEGLIAGAPKVFIVPDGKLTLAPIGAFLDAEGRYFLERHTISYLGSWRDLQSGSPSGRGEPSPSLVVANPDFDMVLPSSSSAPVSAQRLRFATLPGAELEAQDVAKALSLPPGRVLSGKMAREELIRAVPSPQILHFATHSIPDLQFKVPGRVYDSFEFPPFLAAENPLLQSVIVLAGANRPAGDQEDGLLTGLEISGLRLGATRLVVLSSCESAKGVPVDGQGILGLRAAFAMAGAQSVVMSLWPVDDQAGRQFMQFFYSHLAEDPSEALRMAQLDMRAVSQYKAPFYWAGYVVSGVPGNDGPKKTAVTNATGSFVTPICFEALHGRDMFRVRISGVVLDSQTSPEKVVYDISGPGTDFEENVLLGKAASSNLRGWWIKLIIERQKDYSAFSVQTGAPPLQTGGPLRIVYTLTLKGAPDLFATFDAPGVLPPLTSYTSATVSQGDGVAAVKIDKIGSCGTVMQ